jgi:hypothetical protein
MMSALLAISKCMMSHAQLIVTFFVLMTATFRSYLNSNPVTYLPAGIFDDLDSLTRL